ncbi:uncharacterized protein LOC116345581 [Contarinia nasturtii]|uniref:uncharacterized protein LOC116345581 n=1 Tax=Contarinia nasturtii TaxID=265458 RepID=UPI0012D46E08|nr:uncharacterized protein LOC116345581 [Contarinia nasturtii]
MVRGASDTIGLNGPDLLGNVYAPRGNIHVHSPYLEVSAFNPRSNFIALKKHDNGFDPTFRSTVNILHRKQALQTTKNANNKKIFSWMQWKQKDNTRESPVPQIMLNPLPILHPICIAIQIYNRDSDDPIDNICWDILRAIEEYNKDNESAVNFVSRYRGGAGDEADEGDGRSGMTSGDPSIGSLDVDDNNDDINSSKSSYVIAGGPEKLPCGAKSSDSSKKNHSTKSFQWTLSNWGTNKQNIRVDLASPEDISLDTDNNSSRVVYGTTV